MMSIHEAGKKSLQVNTGLDSENSNRVPVIDKLMSVLELIEKSDKGASITEITRKTAIPRTTVYRILNTLEEYGVVQRNAVGAYVLGLRLLSFAANVDLQITVKDIVRISRSALEDLAQQVSETVKLTILHDGVVRVVDVVLGPDAVTPASRIGTTYPLHAGAASKLLLAHNLEILDGMKPPLERFTSKTITSLPDLRKEVVAIRSEGMSYDRGEWHKSIGALAAPILDRHHNIVAAVSVIFFLNGNSKQLTDKIRDPLRLASHRLSSVFGKR